MPLALLTTCHPPHKGEGYLRFATMLYLKDERTAGRQFNTRLPSGLSSEKVGTSISNRSPLSLTI
jgi:hypothetical protein